LPCKVQQCSLDIITKTMKHMHTHQQNRFAVLPTPDRVHADPALKGNGVTIALLDSGFYPHSDLTRPTNRIVAYHDVTSPQNSLNESATEDWMWHGTMTSVTAAGNGYLSDGIYRGIASEAKVVLVKVGERGKILENNIARGLEWIITNHDRYQIRVVSISLGGDEDVPYRQNYVDELAEEAVRLGLTLVVAAGNSGCTERNQVVPPANAPSVITVGGYDDKNQFDSDPSLYCSSFGFTADGIVKPEIIAPAIWVAAPILPRTDTYRKAEALTQILEMPDYEIRRIPFELYAAAGLPKRVTTADPQTIRAEVELLLRESKIISAHYQHVDGTSFAAPIVASVVAQMLEANPDLTPASIKNILVSTATKIANSPRLRQGYGMLNARAATDQARNETHQLDHNHLLPPRVEKDRLIFYYHNDAAKNVQLAGDFNGWEDILNFQKEKDGTWCLKLTLPMPGRYRYKFIIDGKYWVEDPSNGMKEPDEYGGFNSIVTCG
jgi:serine protease AprX